MRECVFVFGSNLAGRHGAGAALEAVNHWGAEYGIGEGRTGDAYAIPTKDRHIRTLPLEHIAESIARFFDYVRKNPETQFLLTPVGTGLAGYSIWEIEDIMPNKLPRNVWLTGDWFS